MCLVEQQTKLDSVRVRPVTLGDVTCYKLSTSSRPQHHELGGSTTWYLQAHTRCGKARRDCVKPSKRGEIDIFDDELSRSDQFCRMARVFWRVYSVVSTPKTS